MGSDPIMSGSLTLFGFGGVVDEASCGDGRGGCEGAREDEGSAGGGRSLKRKSRYSGKFWFSDPKVRHDPVFGQKSMGAGILPKPTQEVECPDEQNSEERK